jgi:hypothetical protein
LAEFIPALNDCRLPFLQTNYWSPESFRKLGGLRFSTYKKLMKEQSVSYPQGASISREEILQYLMRLNRWSKQTALEVLGVDGYGSDYVLKDFPLSRLKAGDDWNPALAQQYADRETPFPPIILGDDWNWKTRTNKLVIKDGNHRVDAAKRRRDKTILAYVPIEDEEDAPKTNANGVQKMKQAAAELWNEKHVVKDFKGYKIAVNRPADPTYLTLWTPENKRIGTLETRSMVGEMADYLNVRNVEVDAKYRGERLRFAMYQALLENLGPKYKGICAYLPDQANKRQVPKIWKRLGARVSPDSEDYLIVDRTNAGAVKQAALLSADYASTLPDGRAIAQYIASIASGYVDEEMMEEYYRGAKAILSEVPIASLQEGPEAGNIPSKSKLRRYQKMRLETMPPLVVQDGAIEDGNHRYRAAKASGAETVWCYVVVDEEDPEEKTAKQAAGPRHNDAEWATLKDIDTRAGDEFMEWLQDLIGDDTDPSFVEVWDDDSYRLDYLSDWLQEVHGIGTEEHGYVTFWKAGSEVEQLIGDLPVVVYHHTSSAILPKIKKEGLRADVKRINTH